MTIKHDEGRIGAMIDVLGAPSQEYGDMVLRRESAEIAMEAYAGKVATPLLARIAELEAALSESWSSSPKSTIYVNGMEVKTTHPLLTKEGKE